MDDSVPLYCTQTEDGEWIVWFPHPLGGKKVLESFDDESEAQSFWRQQIDSQDLGEN